MSKTLKPIRGSFYQKRHFRQFALEVYLAGETEAERLELAQERARELAGTNPQFDLERFINACLTGKDKSSWRAKKANIALVREARP